MRMPDFDELVGDDLDERERARLRRVHELLVEAGPPAELSPELEAGPDMLVTYRHRRRPGRRPRWLLAAAAAAVLLAVYLGGYVTGNRARAPQAFPQEKLVQLHGTAALPEAWAAIRVGPADANGNWPMKLVVAGLPKLTGDDYYELTLTRPGKPDEPCGRFRTHGGTAVAYLNAPYRLRGAGWAITRQHRGQQTLGPVLLRT